MTKTASLLAGLVILSGLSAALWLNRTGEAAQQPDIHDPSVAVANLDVHKELQATLFASEPVLTNPTNLDIDHRGRLWVCDVMNYRGNNGKRPEGDRILILEDTDGDGKHDKVKTFYQGRDIDSAMGICVLGNRVIVSASPNIFVFTIDDNDKIVKQEKLFTKTGQAQHDHSAHSLVFGPDGKLYWNFGNSGKAVFDKDGKQVVDTAGNPVIDNGKPYYGGMVFRCDMDGRNFEVLGHNFRNNYEVAVDSFGTLWQSDNDDDGNRGVRINYVMEFGNFGYRDELTGAGWQAKRTNMESEIPLRHWHLNDPGVVPNLLQTGAGSPTGICVYEGALLPKELRNQVIHCDAGPSIVRAYPVVKEGAGYQAKIINILDGQKKNNWFRPADACVAPDGSLFVTDWYDPGVGGHAQRNIDRGRIFRVAPPGSKYTVPKFDFTTADGAAEALKSPNLAVRYLAWTALNQLGEKAEPALLKLWQSDDARLRARALWLLGKIKDKGLQYVHLALKDKDPDIRMVGIRLLRQLSFDLPPILEKVVRDPSPQVRREIALALAHDTSAGARDLWVQLAMQHDGKDRWYLEALGIGADRNWDQCLNGWLKTVQNEWNTPAGRDIIWRSRAGFTSEYLGKIIADPKVPVAELPRYFRAFDYQQASDSKAEVLAQLAFGGTADGPRQDLIMAEAISRLKGFDPKKNAKHAAALEKILDRNRGSAMFVDLVDSFNVHTHYADLLPLAQKHAEEQLGVNAVRVLLDKGERALLEKGLRDAKADSAIATAKALGTSADGRTVGLLMPLVKDAKADGELRRQAVRALARSRPGAQRLIELAQAKQLPEDLKAAAGAALQTATWKEVRTDVAKLFPLPPGKNNEPMPPITELVKRKGSVKQGQALYAKEGTCANCHTVNGAGKEVGPDLSEIGKKLSKEAMYESILFPSAGISHNYETYQLATKGGTAVNGVLVSQTPDDVTLKGADAIVRTFKKADVEVLEKSPISLMPADLNKALTAQDLADIVEYLLTLKEARNKK